MVFAGERSFAVPILERRIAAAGLEGRIQFVGIRKDIERLMLASDILLFPRGVRALAWLRSKRRRQGCPFLPPVRCLRVRGCAGARNVQGGGSRGSRVGGRLARPCGATPGYAERQSAGGRFCFLN